MLTTHVNPDPDALCSELALMLYLRSMGKEVKIVNEDAVPERYRLFPYVKNIRKYSQDSTHLYDAVITLDCADLSRIGKVRELLLKDKPVFNIDHHITNDYFGSLNLVIPSASSTAEILFDLFKKTSYRLTKACAFLLYVGIMTDTGSFRYENTTRHTYEVISELMQFNLPINRIYQRLYEMIPLNDLKNFIQIIQRFKMFFDDNLAYIELEKKEMEKFSEEFDVRDTIFKLLRSIKEVEVIVIATQIGPDKTRVNFRSKERVNVAQIAAFFKGGGHNRASGCTIHENADQAQKLIFDVVKKYL